MVKDEGLLLAAKQTWNAELHESTGRAGATPEGRDPNVKVMRLTLTPGEWRKLRVWAAEDDTSMQQVVGEIVRRELASRPSRGF